MKRLINQELIDWAKSLEEYVRFDVSSNTLEVGTNLYVDGDIETPYFRLSDTFNLFNEVTIYFNKTYDNSDFMYLQTDINGNRFVFGIDKGDNFEVDLKITESGTILTNTNTKTLFGNQSIYGSGNIDLYFHQITIEVGTDYLIQLEIESSSNLKVDSTQKLTTLLKAKQDTYRKATIIRQGQNYEVLTEYNAIVFDSNVWKFGLVYKTGNNVFIDNEVLITNPTFDDTITTI